MNKTKLLEHLQSSIYCRLKPSGVSGVGVFAIRDIPKDIDIFQGIQKTKYLPLTKNEVQMLDPNVQQMINDFFVYEGDQVWVNSTGLYQLDMSYYVNSSDTPNVKFFEEHDTFISLRVIKKDEEILTDYTSYDPQWNK